MGAYDTPSEKCPYCNSDCEADWVDVGIGMVQCGPYHCQSCNAYELQSGYNGDPESWTDKERETGWREPAKESQISCIGCEKTPDEIEEYIEYGKMEEVTPTQFVIENEGTYNGFLKNRFYCTSCYIKAGQPLVARS